MSNDVLNAAISYAKRGWQVFPLHGIDSDGNCTCGNSKCPDAGKHPKTRGGLRDASNDLEKIREWFEDGTANIAIATGERSGITVLDVDIGEKGGDKTWSELNRQHGEPQTLIAETGSGGLHVYFMYNSALNTSGNTLGKGVDCRNDGGYVVAPPSKHRSGGRYSWVDEEHPLANLPKHLSKRKETRGRPRKDDPTRKKYTIEGAAEMLEFVSAEDRDMWRHVGIILGREYNRTEKAWEVYVNWADKYEGKKGRNHDEIMREAFYDLSQADGDLSMGTIIKAAIEGGWAPKTGQVPSDNFLYYAPQNNYIYRPTGAFWPGESVDSSCSPINEAGTIVKPTVWLKANRLITSMTKDPIIEAEVTQGFDCREGVIVESHGAALYNGYLPPNIELGDAKLARPFVEHVRRVFNRPGDADQFLDYMAHRVQNPGEKPRFALLIAGEQGVGKDTAIAMCSPAIGVWNVANVEPADLEGSFNEFAAATLIVISEAANHGEMSKWAFNERSKVLIAGTPDYMTVNQKYGAKYSVRLHCGVIVTTNHMTSGIYIPPDDRRYDVIATASRGEMGLEDPDVRAEYFQELWGWFNNDLGASHVAAYLHERDITGFQAATGQRRTDAHREVVTAGMTGDEWLIDALDVLGEPPVVRADALASAVEMLGIRDMTAVQVGRRALHALPRLGYVKLHNPNLQDGRWRYTDEGGVRRRTAVYFSPDRISMHEAMRRWQDFEAEF